MVFVFSPTICSFLFITVIFASAQDEMNFYMYSNCTSKLQKEVFINPIYFTYYRNSPRIPTQKNFTMYPLEKIQTKYMAFSFATLLWRIRSVEILQSCPSSKEAIIWYNWCMLHYSNRNIFSINDVSIYNADAGGLVKYRHHFRICGIIIDLYSLFNLSSTEKKSYREA